jgi:hypothetical protein
MTSSEEQSRQEKPQDAIDRVRSNFTRLQEGLRRLDSVLSGKSIRLQQVPVEEMSYALLMILAELANIAKSVPETRKSAAEYIPLDDLRPSRLVYSILSILQAFRNPFTIRSERILFWFDEFLENASTTVDSLATQLSSRELNFESFEDDARRAVYPYHLGYLAPLPGRAFIAAAEGFIPSIPESQPDSNMLAVNGYLDTNNEVIAQKILASVDKLAEALGYQQTGDREITSGSFIFRSRAGSKESLDELKKRLFKVERAFELAQIDIRQAQVDSIQAQAVRDLLAQLETVNRACVQIGSLLIVKFTVEDKTAVIIRNLTQAEIRVLAEYPEIQNSPEGALAALATAVVSSRGDVDGLTAGSS